MSDLISRSDVLTLLYRIFDKYHMSTDKTTELRGFGTNVFKEIREMPTAYDIDKVVEELELHSFEFGTDTLPAHYVRLEDAIEIVKQGGVADDVCEWKVFDNSLTDEPQWVYKTTCGKYIGEEHTSKAFVYCPYCGKKIKVVE